MERDLSNGIKNYSISVVKSAWTTLYRSLRLGRADVRGVLEGAGCDGRNAYVMACGPESLLLSASEAAMDLGCKFHQETFNF